MNYIATSFLFFIFCSTLTLEKLVITSAQLRLSNEDLQQLHTSNNLTFVPTLNLYYCFKTVDEQRYRFDIDPKGSVLARYKISMHTAY